MTEKATFDQRLNHYMGIEMNKQTSDLLAEKIRSSEDDTRMVYYVYALQYHWALSLQFQFQSINSAVN